MTHIENIRKGDYIAVIDSEHTEFKILPLAYQANVIEETVEWSGRPLRVEAIGPPFIFVHDPIAAINEEQPQHSFEAIDNRMVKWTKLPKDYVKAWLKAHQRTIPKDLATKAEREEQKSRTHGQCPQCDQRMSERLFGEKWRLTCSTCDVVLMPLDAVGRWRSR